MASQTFVCAAAVSFFGGGVGRGGFPQEAGPCLFENNSEPKNTPHRRLHVCTGEGFALARGASVQRADDHRTSANVSYIQPCKGASKREP